MININRLIDCDWYYIQAVETQTALTIRELLNNTLPGTQSDPKIDMPNLTTGNSPIYDFSLNYGLFELKCSSKPDILKVEFNSNGNPSGICVTQAHYYVFINPGCSKINGEWVDVSKLRVVSRAFLVNRVLNLVKMDPACIISDDNGSKWVELNAKDLPNDGWIADLRITHLEDLLPVFEVVKPGSTRNIMDIGQTCLLGVELQKD